MSIPIRTETLVDSIDVGEWLSIDLEEPPENPEIPGCTAIYVVRIGDVQFRIQAPYLDAGPVEVLEASRVKDEPRTKFPDLKNLRPQVVRFRRRPTEADADASDDTDDEESQEPS